MVRDILNKSCLVLEPNENFDSFRRPIINKKPLQPFIEIKDKLELPLGSKGRIVCRCEQVTEDEIVDALHRGIKLKTIDAVKDEFSDIKHSGVNRVQKSELLDYLKSIKEY